MKRIFFLSAMTLLGLVILAGGGAAYYFLGLQDRGMTRDGHMAPPASVRNAPEAPRFEASKVAAPAKPAEQPPEMQLPTEFKLPTDVNIEMPNPPEGSGNAADGAKT